MKKYILTALALFACGAPDPNELGELEQTLLTDDNFGVQESTMAQCNPGVGGTCYYPPGFGDGSPAQLDGVPWQWKVCVDSNTLDGLPNDPNSQKARAVVKTNQIRAEFTNNAVWSSIVNCITGGPNIIVRGANVDRSAYSTSDIRRYVLAECNVRNPLTESPGIAGSHWYCEKWTIHVNFDAIDSAWALGSTNNHHVSEHALGAGLSASMVGSGQHSSGDYSSFWSYSPVSPFAKHGLVVNDYCRANARYENPNYTQLTKIDNACD